MYYCSLDARRLVDDAVGFDHFGRRGDCLLDDAALQMRQACQASVNLLAGVVSRKSTDRTSSGCSLTGLAFVQHVGRAGRIS